MISPGDSLPIDELLAALDEQVDLLERKRSQLAELSAALIARNDDATERLLGELEQTEAVQRAADMRLGAVRSAVAAALGAAAVHVRLAELIEYLPSAQAAAVRQRRQHIIRKAAALRAEHLRTVLHLAEAARINRLLLESLLPGGESVVTYGARGSDHWRPEAGLVDTEL